jgi:hypothetical protein
MGYTNSRADLDFVKFLPRPRFLVRISLFCAPFPCAHT